MMDDKDVTLPQTHRRHMFRPHPG